MGPHVWAHLRHFSCLCPYEFLLYVTLMQPSPEHAKRHPATLQLMESMSTC